MSPPGGLPLMCHGSPYLHTGSNHAMLELSVVHHHGAPVTDGERCERYLVNTGEIQVHHVVHFQGSCRIYGVKTLTPE